MAKKLNYEIGFHADTSELKGQMKEVQKILQEISDFSYLRKTDFSFTQDIQAASAAAKDLQLKLQQATNIKTGSFDLTTFRQSLERSGVTLEDYARKLVAIGPQGQEAFYQVANAISQAQLPMMKMNSMMNELWITMKNTMRWQITSSAMHGFMGALQTSYGYAKDLNSSLNNIRIVSGQSAEQMAEFAKQANKAAKELSTTTVDYTDAALIYYQQGLPDDEVQERTNATIKMANVTGDAVEDVSSQLTAIWNNFYDGTKSLEYYADVITALGAATASSTAEISEGLEKFAAIGETIGLSYEYATASLATIVSQTRQAPETVGTALKTIFARIQGLSLGETLDDGTNLNKYSDALNKVGINIFDTNGQLKDMDDILDELGSKWDGLNKAQQMALAQTVAGVRQYTQLIALLDNYGEFQENLAIAQGSEGALTEQAEIFEESWRAASRRVKASAEGIYDSILEDEAFINLLDLTADVLTGFEKLVDGAGGLNGVLALTATLFMRAFGDKTANLLRDVAYNIGVNTGRTYELNTAMKQSAADLAATMALEADAGYADIQAQKIAMQLQLNNAAEGLTEIQVQQLQNEIEYFEFLGKLKVRQDEVAQSASARLKETKDFIEKFESEKLADPTKIPTSVGYSTETWGTIKQSGATGKYRGNDLSDLTTTLESLISQSTKLNSVITKLNSLNLAFEEGSIDADKYAKELEALESQIREFGFKTKTGAGITLFDKNSGQYQEQGLRDLMQLNRALNDQNGVIEKVKGALEKYLVKLEKQGMDVKELKIHIDALTNSSERLARAQLNARDIQVDLDDRVDNYGNNINNAAVASYDWAFAIQQVSNEISGLAMLLSGLKSLTEQVKSGEADLVTVLGSLGIMLGGLVQTGTTVRTVYTALLGIMNAATDANTLSLGQNTLAHMMNAAATSRTGMVVSRAATAMGLFTASTSAATKAVVMFASRVFVWAAAGIALYKIFDKLHISQKEATEAIDDATESYRIQKEALDKLNNSLKSVQERIEELSNQDTLTIVEQDELDKLKQEEAYLKQQIALQDKLARAEQKNQAEVIEKNFNAQSSFIDNAPIEGISKNKGLKDDETGADIEETADEWFARVTQGLEKTSSAYKKYQEEYNAWVGENNEALIEWAGNNADKIKDVEASYKAYADAVNNGVVEYNDEAITQMQNKLQALRDIIYSDGEQWQLFIKPIIDDNFTENELKGLYQTVVKNGQLDNYRVSSDLRKDLLANGISEEQLFNRIAETAQKAKENVQQFADSATDEEIQHFFKQLSVEDYSILANINLNGIDDWNEFYNRFLEVKDNASITLEFALAKKSASEALDTLGKGEFLDQDTIDTLVNQFSGIMDLTGLENQSMYDQARLIGQAWYAAVMPQEIVADTKENLYELQKAYKEFDAVAEEAGWDNFEKQNRKQELEFDIDKAKKQLEELEDFELSPIDVEFDKGAIDAILAQMGAIEKATSLIGEGFKVEAENVEDLFKTMPQLFEDAIVDAKTGIVQLNEDIVRSARNAAAQEAEGWAGSMAETLQARINWGNNQIDALNIVKDTALSASDTVYINELLNEKGLKAEKAKSVAAIIQAKIQQATQERTESQKTSKMSIYDQQQVTKAAQLESTQTAQNWADGMSRINDVVHSAMTNAAFYQNEAEQGREPQKRNIKGGVISTVGRSKGDSTLSWGYDNIDLNNPFDIGKTYATESDGKIFDYDKVVNEAVEKFTENAKKAGLTNDQIAANLEAVRDGASKKMASDIYKQYSSLGFDLGNKDDAIKAIQSGGDDFANLFVSENYGTNTDAFALDLDAALSDKYNELGEYISLLSKLSSKNASLQGLTDAGKGSGGGKALADLKEVTERYHEITREIQYQEEELDKLRTTIDRTYGLDKIKLYTKEQEKLNTLLGLQQDKLNAAKAFQAMDLNDIKKLGLAPEIDPETFEITNYTKLLEKITADYNAFKDATNEADKKAAEDLYDKRIKALENYEDSIDKTREQLEKLEEIHHEFEDSKLTELNAKLELVLDIKKSKDEVRDFAREIIESFGDELTHGKDSLQNQFVGALANMDLQGEFASQQANLIDLINKANQYSDEEALKDSLDDLRGEIIETGEALLEWLETLETAFPEAIDAARERFQVFTGELAHNKDILDTMKEIVELQNSVIPNQTKQDKYSFIDKATSSQLEAVMGQAQLEKKRYDESREALELAWQVLQGYDEGDAGYDGAYNNWVALLAENQEAEQAWLNKTKEAMEQAQAIYLNAIENISYNFEQAITNNMGLDLLQDKYDNYIEEEERYLDEVNELYEINKYNNKLQKDIDNTTNQAHRAQLQALQQEIEARAENNKLSEYDLQIMEAKYNALQKQIALEEAQNNKSEVRLRRDAQGNWSYVFTSNQDEIAAAEQELADANNEYYNIAKQEVKEVTGEIIATWQEMNDKIKEVYEDESLTVAEREAQIAEIREYYKNKILDLEEQKNIALEDMTAAGSETIQNFGNEYGDTLDDMANVSDNFAETFDNYIQEMENSLKEYEETTSDIGNTTGTTYEDLEEKIEDTSNATEYFTEVGLDATDMMWEQLDILHEQINGYLDYADAVMEAVRALQQLANQNVDTKVNISQQTPNYDNNVDYMALAMKAATTGNTDIAMSFLESREAKVKNEGLGEYNAEDDRDLMEAIAKMPDEGKGKLVSLLSGAYTTDQVMALLREYGVAMGTGGYTGLFDGVKAAFLHEKELVLNQQDTENILSAVSAVRALEPTLLKTIEQMLDVGAMNSLRSMGGSLSTVSNFTTEPGTLEQMINITAEFPTATDQNEIREAILGLANYATQFVNKR